MKTNGVRLFECPVVEIFNECINCDDVIIVYANLNPVKDVSESLKPLLNT